MTAVRAVRLALVGAGIRGMDYSRHAVAGVGRSWWRWGREQTP